MDTSAMDFQQLSCPGLFILVVLPLIDEVHLVTFRDSFSLGTLGMTYGTLGALQIAYGTLGTLQIACGTLAWDTWDTRMGHLGHSV